MVDLPVADLVDRKVVGATIARYEFAGELEPEPLRLWLTFDDDLSVEFTTPGSGGLRLSDSRPTEDQDMRE
jgi:hypothetical protein